MIKLVVYQDGADFYIREEGGPDSVLEVWSAPFKVSDFDMDAANRARGLFESHMTGREFRWAGIME